MYICESCVVSVFFLFRKKKVYDLRMSDWSSDVCSSDLTGQIDGAVPEADFAEELPIRLEPPGTRLDGLGDLPLLALLVDAPFYREGIAAQRRLRQRNLLTECRHDDVARGALASAHRRRAGHFCELQLDRHLAPHVVPGCRDVYPSSGFLPPLEKAPEAPPA